MIPPKGESLPEWLCQTEAFVPENRKNKAAQRTLLEMTALLQQIKIQNTAPVGQFSPPAAIVILAAVWLILLTSLSQSREFLWLVGVLLLIRLALLPAKQLLAVLKPVCSAGILTGLVLLPWGITAGFQPAGKMLLKVCLCVGFAASLFRTVSWNRITGGLAALHLPQLFIATLDMALLYLSLLGKTAKETLEAYQLRCIGRSAKKQTYYALGSIAGQVFLKSVRLGEEMYDAMTCRCYRGVYPAVRRDGNRFCGILLLVLCAALTLLFWKMR
jgi:cobalt/nickel transport system permease protein